MKTFSRFGLVTILALAACGGGPSSTAPSATLATATPTPTPAPATVRFGQVGSVSDGAIFIADAKGYFKEQAITLDSVPFNSAAQMVAPLGTGELDAGGGAPSAGLYNAVNSGVQLRIVADKGTITAGHGYEAVIVRKALAEKVKSAKDFKGLKVSIAVRFMVAYLKGARFYTDAFDKKDAAKRTEAIDIIAKATKLDPTLIGRIVMPNVDPDGKVNTESLNASQQYFVQKGTQAKAVDLSKVVDGSFAAEAIKPLGAYK